MIKIKNIFVEDLDNAGCNNGNYPDVAIELDNGEKLEAVTCRCGNGCSNTANINAVEIGDCFDSVDELLSIIYPEFE